MLENVNIHDRYTKLEKSFKAGEISLDDYTREIITWNQDFSGILKAMKTDFANDLSHGGKLHKKTVIDKTGKKQTKWVSEDQLSADEQLKLATEATPNTQFKQTDAESRYTLDDWKKKAPKASEKSLENAAKFAGSESIRKIARDELLKRSFSSTKYMDLSLLPDFMLNSFVERYDNTNEQITVKENESLASYRDFGYASLNKQLRSQEKLDKKQTKELKDIDNAIDKSELQHDIILHRGLNGKDSLLFINYLNSLEAGDIYEELSFSSTSLVAGQANKFKQLYSSVENVTLKIYASKGQKALCMQNLGGADEKIMYNDEYEFLLPRNSKFQIIENKDNIISIKLL